MYNRYIPEQEYDAWTRAEAPPAGGPSPGSGRRGGGPLERLLSGGEGLGALWSGGEGRKLSGLLRALRLESLEAGDILLLLIVLYLLVEGEDLEPVLALGLVLLLGLGED